MGAIFKTVKKQINKALGQYTVSIEVRNSK